MPPEPSSSRISSCGKAGASSAGVGGTKRPAGGWSVVGTPAACEGPARPAASRHWGQSPPGASAGKTAPHFGQVAVSGMAKPPSLQGTPLASALAHSCLPLPMTEKWQKVTTTERKCSVRQRCEKLADFVSHIFRRAHGLGYTFLEQLA